MESGSDQEMVFGPFRLDIQGRTLHRHGNIVPLRARSFDILCVLVGAGGDLVSKDALMARVWPGVFVEENTLQVHVSALRKALGEDVDGQRYILTVPGQGYRFIGKRGEQPIAAAVSPGGGPQPALPDRPSIAVMPFQNMSGNLEQDYFTDGVVEDIITALSRIRWLFVIARDSTFRYKGRAVDVKDLGEELGVRYLLQGSVRTAANRVRITGQLVDVRTSSYLWVDRFDRALVDIFDLQDEIAACVVSAIAPKLELAEIDRVKRKPTESLDAYDSCLRGMASFYEERREASNEALRLFYKAIELDANFAFAHAMAARCYLQRQIQSWMVDRQPEAAEAARLAWRAASLGPDDATTLCIAGYVLAHLIRELEAGAGFIGRAVELNANLAPAWYYSAWVNIWLGEPELAIEHAEHAMRLSPVDLRLYVMQDAIASAHISAGRYDVAVAWAEKALRLQSRYQPTLRLLAVSYALSGRIEQARATLARLREVNPQVRIADLPDILPYRRPEDFARYADALRMAGLPE